ncbi:MAG TPA: PQQ-dependent sugar dehydrogenase [Allosphingosinicella sp.]
MRTFLKAAIPLLALIGCAGNSTGGGPAEVQGASRPFQVQPIGTFDSPWAMTFIPGEGRRALITEKGGRLLLWSEGAAPVEVSGVPEVDEGGQGGLGDVVIHPRFAENGLVYLSWVEAGEGGTRGAAVGRGRLLFTAEARPGARAGVSLDGFQVIWRQSPKRSGRGHFGHRIAFGPDGKLYISNGDRQEFTPAQDMSGTLGKIVRLNDDGSLPADNPFANRGGAAAQIWSLGHRNPLGLAFDPQGRLWNSEMGPRGGDELNLVERGSNQGYPIVSDGSHYNGSDIPDHATRPEFNAPEVVWTPVISPSSLIFYSGGMFPAWRGNALLGGLSGEALVRVEVSGNRAREVERYAMNARIREVEQGPDGAVYLLEDGPGGRLLRLVPAR